MRLISVLLSLALSSLATGVASALTLDEYKSQVHAKDPSWRAAQLAEQGSHALLDESRSMTALQFTSELDYMDDRRLTTNPSFMGDQTTYNGFFLGLKQLTSFGAQWALTENFTHTHIFDASPIGIPIPEFYEAYPKLELKLSLWRNFLGAETGAEIKSLDAQTQLRFRQAEVLKLQKEIEIETAFAAVLAQQESLETAKDSLARAEKVLDWTKSRIARNLADQSDVYQSQAAVVARRLDLVNNEKSLRDAMAKFNDLRQEPSREPKEKLVPPQIEVERLNLSLNQLRVRKDIRLKEFEAVGAEASARAQREKHKPSLDLSVSALKQGRDSTAGSAQTAQFENNHNYMVASLNLTFPINQFAESRFREGYLQLVKSQQLIDESLGRDEKLTWENTVELAKQLRSQWSLVRELEGLQKSKADAERDKFNHGRSVLFQVLSYEQDFLATRAQRISLELLIRQFVSQLSLFE